MENEVQPNERGEVLALPKRKVKRSAVFCSTSPPLLRNEGLEGLIRAGWSSGIFWRRRFIHRAEMDKGGGGTYPTNLFFTGLCSFGYGVDFNKAEEGYGGGGMCMCLRSVGFTYLFSLVERSSLA